MESKQVSFPVSLGSQHTMAPGVHCNGKPRSAEGRKSWATGPIATGLSLLPALSLSLTQCLTPQPQRVKGRVCSTLTLTAAGLPACNMA